MSMTTDRPAERGRSWKRLGCYFPLIALVLEIAWLLVLFLGFIFMVGDAPYTNTETKNRISDFFASLPVVAGLAVGVTAIVGKWPDRKWEWICLIVGTLICAVLTLGFAYGLVG